MRCMPLSVSALLLLAGCGAARYHEVGATDMTWGGANWSCVHAMYAAYPISNASFLAGFVGGAAGGALVGLADGSGTTEQRVAVYRACMLRHGWQQNG
jgi:hypothetical protein